jgi:hypothetical protein
MTTLTLLILLSPFLHRILEVSGNILSHYKPI